MKKIRLGIIGVGNIGKYHADYLLEGKVAPGEDGVNSVELANVMVYSSLLGQTVELPMDGAAWEKKLNQLIAESKLEKKVVKTAADDFAGSFRK